MFREGIMSFLGIGEKKESIEDKYCSACRLAKKDDCRNCSREIGIIENVG